MHSVLLVDDDAAMHTYLKAVIPWEAEGFAVQASALNGQEALALAKALKPSLIITDMDMPVMDGVQLMENLAAIDCGAELLCVSAYGDFRYVRSALTRGAVDFMLKSDLTPESFSRVLARIRERIEAKGVREDVQTLFAKDKLVYQHLFVDRLLSGTVPSERCEQIARNLDLSMRDDSRSLLMLIRLDDAQAVQQRYTQEEMNRFVLVTLREMVAQILAGTPLRAEVFLNGEAFLAWLSTEAPMRGDVDGRIRALATRLAGSISTHLNIPVHIGLSEWFEGFEGMGAAHAQAQSALSYGWLDDQERVALYGDRKRDRGRAAPFRLSIEEEKQIGKLLRLEDEQGLRECLQALFGKALQSQADEESLRMVCAEILCLLGRVCREMGIDTERVYCASDFIGTLSGKQVEHIHDRVWSLFRQYLLAAREKRILEAYSEYTRAAIRFIMERFQGDISLEDAAREIGLSPAYLSRVFAKETGIGFAKYLTQYRIDISRTLIEAGETKVVNLYQMAGFTNYNYFFHVFKSVVGMTPTAYQQRVTAQKKEGLHT